MERAGHAANAASEKTKETASAASKEQNKAIMNDSDAPVLDRVSAAGGAAKDAMAEQMHSTKYEYEKKQATN